MSLDDQEKFQPKSSVYLKGHEKTFRQGLRLLSKLSSHGVRVIASVDNDFANPLLPLPQVTILPFTNFDFFFTGIFYSQLLNVYRIKFLIV